MVWGTDHSGGPIAELTCSDDPALAGAIVVGAPTSASSGDDCWHNSGLITAVCPDEYEVISCTCLHPWDGGCDATMHTAANRCESESSYKIIAVQARCKPNDDGFHDQRSKVPTAMVSTTKSTRATSAPGTVVPTAIATTSMRTMGLTITAVSKLLMMILGHLSHALLDTIQ